MKIAVFVSGNGTNLQNIIDAVENGKLPNIEIEIVIADRDCYAIERSLNHNIRTYVLDRKKFSEDAQHNLEDENIELIILAGFLTILSQDFINKWKNKIINIHPSLLPKYGGQGMYGAKVHKAILDAKEVESGATVHYVTAEVDEGKIIAQKSFIVNKGDKIEDLQRKVAEIEGDIYIKAIKQISNT